MTKEEMIWIATKWFSKGYIIDDLRWSDDMYGYEDKTEEVKEYYFELQDIGRIAFYEKYKEFRLY